MTRDKLLWAKMSQFRGMQADLSGTSKEAMANKQASWHDNTNRIKEANIKMDKWIFSENAIIVPCRVYV
jgi:hypothetical protein